MEVSEKTTISEERSSLLPAIGKVVIATQGGFDYFASVNADNKWRCLFTNVQLDDVIAWAPLESLRSGGAINQRVIVESQIE